MEPKRVLVTLPVEQSHVDRLKQTAPGWKFRFRGSDRLFSGTDLERPPVTREDVAWAQVILGNVPAQMLSGSSELLWLQTNSAGVEPYLQPGVLGETTLLTNATGAYGLAIAEHLLGMLLELFKKLELYRDAQKQGAWQSLGQVRAVYGATVLVLGMGDIGGEFGKRCKALGAKVIGVRRSPRACPGYADVSTRWRIWTACCPGPTW